MVIWNCRDTGGKLSPLPSWLEGRKTLTEPPLPHHIKATFYQPLGGRPRKLAAISRKGKDWQRLISSQNCQEGWRIGRNWVVSHSRDPGTTQEWPDRGRGICCCRHWVLGSRQRYQNKFQITVSSSAPLSSEMDPRKTSLGQTQVHNLLPSSLA